MRLEVSPPPWLPRRCLEFFAPEPGESLEIPAVYLTSSGYTAVAVIWPPKGPPRGYILGLGRGGQILRFISVKEWDPGPRALDSPRPPEPEVSPSPRERSPGPTPGTRGETETLPPSMARFLKAVQRRRQGATFTSLARDLGLSWREMDRLARDLESRGILRRSSGRLVAAPSPDLNT